MNGHGTSVMASVTQLDARWLVADGTLAWTTVSAGGHLRRSRTRAVPDGLPGDATADDHG